MIIKDIMIKDIMIKDRAEYRETEIAKMLKEEKYASYFGSDKR